MSYCFERKQLEQTVWTVHFGLKFHQSVIFSSLAFLMLHRREEENVSIAADVLHNSERYQHAFVLKEWEGRNLSSSRWCNILIHSASRRSPSSAPFIKQNGKVPPCHSQTRRSDDDTFSKYDWHSQRFLFLDPVRWKQSEWGQGPREAHVIASTRVRPEVPNIGE